MATVLTHCPPDLAFVTSVRFAWKVAVIVAVSSLPLYIIKLHLFFILVVFVKFKKKTTYTHIKI